MKFVILLLALCGGCSLISARGPSPERPTCTTSYAAPIVDTVATAVFGGLTAAAAWGAFHSTGLEQVSYNVAWPAAALPTTGFALSGIFGYVRVAHCRNATR